VEKWCSANEKIEVHWINKQFNCKEKEWSWRDSNPRPEKAPESFLHA